MVKQGFKYFLFLSFLFLYGFSPASASPAELNALEYTGVSVEYAGVLTFTDVQNRTSVSPSRSSENHHKNTEHHSLFMETENEENDEDLSSHHDFLKYRNYFITLFHLQYFVDETDSGRYFYPEAEANTLPTDHFLYLEYQVFRI